ncbi:MAG: hypothetical protein P4L90_00675 [Rhodopila sp.]|nr:hypothetical protein [Rhodopila sp.]
MGRLAAVTTAILVSAGSGVPALAWERGPVCREPSVVDEMTRQIRDRDYYSIVDPQLVTEQPTADPRMVRCQVCVQLAPYDMTRFGDYPIKRCVAHGFEVQILSSGFVVRDLR